MRKHGSGATQTATDIVLNELKQNPTGALSERFLLELEARRGQEGVAAFLARNLDRKGPLKLSVQEWAVLQDLGLSDQEREMSRRQFNNAAGTVLAGGALSGMGYKHISEANQDMDAHMDYVIAKDGQLAREQAGNLPPAERKVIAGEREKLRQSLQAKQGEHRMNVTAGASVAGIGHAVKALAVLQVRGLHEGNFSRRTIVDEDGNEKAVVRSRWDDVQAEVRKYVGALKEMLDAQLAQTHRQGKPGLER